MEKQKLRKNLETSVESLELIRDNLKAEMSVYETANLKMIHESNKYSILNGRLSSENFYFDKEIPKISETISRVILIFN